MASLQGSAHASSYPSDPLDATKNEIRILHLLLGSVDDEMVCELEKVSLDIYGIGTTFGAPYSEDEISRVGRSIKGGYAAHRLDLRPRENSFSNFWTAPLCDETPCKCYEALSYTWNPASKKRAIRLNGQAGHMVMETLFRALRRFRSVQHARLLWVDSLCISQVDNEEKSQQVRLMSRIFGSAARVLVWLGDTDGERNKFDMKSLLRHVRPHHASRSQPIESADIRITDLSRALTNAERFWWERAWIIQEYVLAKNMPVFCFGSYVIEDGDMIDLLEPSASQRERRQLRSALLELQDIRLMLKNRGKGVMTGYVSSMRRASATDPRDKVFSIVGMIREEEARQVHIDYSSSYSSATAFAQATCVTLASAQDLGPLVYVEFIDRDPALPTWAIDFDCPNTERKHLSPAANWKPTRAQWCTAEPDSRRWVDLEKYLLKLQVTGLRFDRIAGVVHFPLRSPYDGRFDGRPIVPEQTNADAFVAVLQHLPNNDPYKALADPSTSRNPGESANESIDWSTLMAAGGKKLYSGPDSSPTAFRWLEKLFYAWAEDLSITRLFNGIKTDRIGLLNEWVRYAQFVSGDTVAFTTEKGFLGMAPNSARVGDEITLLHGSTVPAVLRPAADEFAFRGFCHVWGVSAPSSDPLPNMLAVAAPGLRLDEKVFTLQ